LSGSSALILAAGLALSLYVAWCLGANDAANPTNCAVGSGVLDLRKALTLFAAFASLGALLQGYMVMKTIGRGVVPSIDLLGTFTVMLAAGLWITLCTYKGLPISTSQSIVGSVIGYGLATRGLGGVNWGVMWKIVASWVVSPLLAIALTALTYRWLAMPLYRRYGGGDGRLVTALLVASLCFSAYAFGANDVGNATGVFVTVMSALGMAPESAAMMALAALGSLGIALGGFTWGYRVIRTVAYRVTRLDPYTGMAAGLSTALTIYLFTTVPYALIGYGMPISTTHSSVGSVIGAGLVRGRRVNRLTVLLITASWLLTVPASASISYATYALARLLA